MDEKTQEIYDWMLSLDDREKMRFALNWRMPHSLFNIASRIRGGGETLQGVDWYRIFAKRDMGYWSNGNKVIVGAI